MEKPYYPNWHSDVENVETVENVVVSTSVSDVVTTSLANVIRTLPQSCCKVATTFVARPFYYRLF